MTVKAILSHKGSDVITIDPAADLAAAARVLIERDIGALVVTGVDNRVVGILSERHIVRAIAERGAKALDVPIAEVMTRKVVTCGIDETVIEIMAVMTAGKFRYIPVVEQGRLDGIVSIGDVVKWRLNDMKQESAGLREYIATACVGPTTKSTMSESNYVHHRQGCGVPDPPQTTRMTEYQREHPTPRRGPAEGSSHASHPADGR